MSLSKLIDEVEAGSRGDDFWSAVHVLPAMHITDVTLARDGSLDAAKSLHDALLPGWQWLVRSSDDQDVRSGRCQHGQFLANIWREGSPNEGAEHFPTWVDDPARAWLLAILRALEQEGR